MDIAVVLIRGRISISRPLLDTLDQLGLNKKHACAVVPESALGMLQKVKDYCTWGQVNAETVATLKARSKEEKRIRTNLHPPRGGFERKGIKKSYAQGGALGPREEMDALIMRML